MNYIGVDCHISSLDFAVVDEKGTVTKRAKVNTGVKKFIEFVVWRIQTFGSCPNHL